VCISKKLAIRSQQWNVVCTLSRACESSSCTFTSTSFPMHLQEHVQMRLQAVPPMQTMITHHNHFDHNPCSHAAKEGMVTTGHPLQVPRCRDLCPSHSSGTLSPAAILAETCRTCGCTPHRVRNGQPVHRRDSAVLAAQKQHQWRCDFVEVRCRRHGVQLVHHVLGQRQCGRLL
jgi:hypothetical protein